MISNIITIKELKTYKQNADTKNANTYLAKKDAESTYAKKTDIEHYSLAAATASKLGGVIIGGGLAVDTAGKISVKGTDASGNAFLLASTAESTYAKKTDIRNYTLPAASATQLGGVKIGSGISVQDGTISVAVADLTPYVKTATAEATYAKISTLADYPKLENKLIPAKFLPSYVDDVIEAANKTALDKLTGETGKIYVTTDNGYTYRWGGKAFIRIGDAVSTADKAVKDGNGNVIASTYETSAHAGSTYMTKTEGASLLSRADAETTYAKKSELTHYTLPPASGSALGGVMVGSGITVDKAGKISVDLSPYAKTSSLSAYLTTGAAASTYMTKTEAAAYLKSADAAKTYIKTSDLTEASDTDIAALFAD